MPRRSHDLQQLLYAITRQLAGRARIAEWLLVRGRDGTPREVDLVVEVTAGGRPVRYAVEYHDHARPADVAWIEQLSDKYRDLPLDAVVAVARRGLTAAARTAAAASAIRALTLAEARRADWALSLGVAVGSTRGPAGGS